MYDAIIIGAGPSGNIVAKKLAENGLNVLIVEKNRLPRNKSCSGVLIKRSKELIQENFGEIPTDVTCSPINTRGIVIENELGKEYMFEDDGVNIWRDRLDHWLAQQACDCGAELLDQTTVLEFLEDGEGVSLRVKCNGKEDTIRGRIVVACDGVNGASRKKLNAEVSRHIVTYQAFYHGTGSFDPRCFYAFLNEAYSEYDAWVNTKDDLVFIGVGVKKAGNAKAYHDRFIDYLRVGFDLNLTDKVGEEYWTLPIIIPDFQTVLGRGKTFFAGEAANLINPMGEGISIAMASGLAVSKAILRVYSEDHLFDEDKILKCYSDEMKLEIEHMKRQWVFLRHISPSFWKKLDAEG